jgi:hypothetical protein
MLFVFCLKSVLIVKVVLNILCFELLINAFAFLVESKNVVQKALPNGLTVFDIR